MTKALTTKQQPTESDIEDLIDKLRLYAEIRPDSLAVMFHHRVSGDEVALSYAELYRKICLQAAVLQQWGLADQVVILTYPPGLEFVVAFLATLLAGAIAVPAPTGSWITRKRTSVRLRHIINSSNAHAFLAPQAIIDNIKNGLCREGLQLISDEDWQQRKDPGCCLSPYDRRCAAYLQYSSGSTFDPKAVIITHHNLACNCAAGNRMMEYDKHTISLCWMPHFHDYALVNGICQPLYCGGQVHLMSPDSFLRSPQRWLELIDHYAVTHAGGPNFAWRYCVEHSDVNSMYHLDLSRWRYAHCAAEPIQQVVMQQFVRQFSSLGFRAAALHSCYGLAESVAFVTTGCLIGEKAWRAVPGLPQSIVANCGRGDESLQLYIVDPDTRECCADDVVGEVWFRHGSVGCGYWQLTQVSDDVFHAFTKSGEGPFLRTGDLGFLHDQDLFICGRCKDVLIVNGQNFYPQDLEILAQSISVLFRADAGAAFQVDALQGQPYLVLVQEITGRHNEAELSLLVNQIRQKASEQLELHRIDEIVFIRSGSLDKTSSGKVMRQRTARRWQERSMDVLWNSVLPKECESAISPCSHLPVLPALVCDILKLDVEQLHSNHSLLNLGLDSLNALRLHDALRKQGIYDIPVDKLFYMTLQQLCQWSIDNKQLVKDLPKEKDCMDQAVPFRLSALQSAYLAGRDSALPLGGIGCSYYQEIRFDKEFDQQRLQQVWQILLKRHDCLRLVFNSETQQQRVLQEVPYYAIPVIDLCTEWEREALRMEMRSQLRSGRVWPLFDLRVSRFTDVVHLHFCIDLLLIDAQGTLTLLAELASLYKQPDVILPPISGSFRQVLASGVGQRQPNPVHWDLPGPVLPLQNKPEHVSRPHFRRLQTHLSRGEWQVLQEKASSAGVTINSVMLTALADVLRLWSQQSDFLLIVTAQEYSTSASQQHQPALGDYTRSLWLPMRGSRISTFIERLRSTFRQLNERLSKPGADIFNLSDINEQGVPVVFTSLAGTDSKLLGYLPGVGKTVDSISMTPQVALDFQLVDDDQDVTLTLDYAQEVFSQRLPGVLLTGWQRALSRLVDSSWEQACYPLIPDEQKQRRLSVDSWMVQPELLSQSVERQMHLTPQRLAVLATDGELTYGELFEQVVALQDLLQQQKLQPGQVVALDLLKGWRQVVAVIAVLRAGGIYLPLDRSWPHKRIHSILANAPADYVISDRLKPQALSFTGQWLHLTERLPVLAVIPQAEPIDPQTTAYLIYTSGSTGTPKGVAISHYSALNTVMDINRRFQINNADRLLSVSALAFDLSVYDLFGALSTGAVLLLPAAQSNLDPAELAKFALQTQATVWNSVPALFQLQVDYARLTTQKLAENLRLVLLSGDYIPLDLADKARALNPQLSVISLGGATEASIWSCYYPVGDALADWSGVPYGYSLNQQSLHVLNESLADCPDEVAGDLYIGGVGLAQGYWGDAQRTADSFIVHPDSGQRLYRTGDRARFRDDGLVEFLGRADRQLKIGGYRIEPGEIESALQVHSGVKRCIVSGIEWVAGSGPQLVAFICQDNVVQVQQVPREPWIQFLCDRLPGYMLPARFIVLPELPLTTNGKVDHKQLDELAHYLERDLNQISNPFPEKTETINLQAHWLDDWLYRRLGHNELDEQASLISLGLTSLDILGLAAEMEHYSSMKIRATELIRLPSLAQLRQWLAEKQTKPVSIRSDRHKLIGVMETDMMEEGDL